MQFLTGEMRQFFPHSSDALIEWCSYACPRFLKKGIRIFSGMRRRSQHVYCHQRKGGGYVNQSKGPSSLRRKPNISECCKTVFDTYIPLLPESSEFVSSYPSPRENRES
ncbi:hypothetical protein CRM22_003868 [Opisthorchis felineus]|uniref:Uncharacterized protein n=1 Tax=Opisthorchis felineus TaxID=147828 RepID=A0A4S2LZ32_OPIFE|nr:hypothetical protein CRM22_003868 [Opisthorchis felineus]